MHEFWKNLISGYEVQVCWRHASGIVWWNLIKPEKLMQALRTWDQLLMQITTKPGKRQIKTQLILKNLSRNQNLLNWGINLFLFKFKAYCQWHVNHKQFFQLWRECKMAGRMAETASYLYFGCIWQFHAFTWHSIEHTFFVYFRTNIWIILWPLNTCLLLYDSYVCHQSTN